MKNIDSQLAFCLDLHHRDDDSDDYYEDEDSYIEEDGDCEEETDDRESLIVECEMWKRLYEKTMNQLVENQFNFQLQSLTAKKQPTPKKIEKPVVAAAPVIEKVSPSSGKVNVNTATKGEIMETGLGEITARYIIAYRKKHGPFKSVDELLNVSRFGRGCMVKYGDKFDV
jgi:competence protein ComEA